MTRPPLRLILWRVILEAPESVVQRAQACLAPTERERAARLRRPVDSRRLILAHAALRQILGAALGAEPVALTIGRTEHGRPYLAGAWAGRLDFNLSHSGDRAAIALIPAGAQVGVDVEQYRAMRSQEEIAARFFHPEEAAALRALDGATRERAFFACWTRKEAVLKAHGSGIAGGLKRFAVGVEPGQENPHLVWHEPLADGAWVLRSFDAGHGAAGALALWSPGPVGFELELREWDWF